MAVFFHGNYGMHRGRMARMVGRLRRFPEATHREIGEFFGYSQAYSARYRSWLHKCGMVLPGRPFELTEWGRVVVEHDRALESQATQWFLHWELVTHPTRAQVWHRFWHDFLDDRSFFQEPQLLRYIADFLRGLSEEEPPGDDRMARSVLNKLIESYTAPQALGQLGLVVTDGDRFLKGAPHIRGPWKTPEEWVAEYETSQSR
ncbi:MAG TPA: DUF4007 family protein [Acidobacteriota bacterium]|nr:DUF4007 family protein [Acidobacteriota bacterium]